MNDFNNDNDCKDIKYIIAELTIIATVVNYCALSLRVLSYNILADLYLNLKNAQEDLFFPYCLKEYQEYNYRYSLLLKELTGEFFYNCIFIE